MVETKGVAQMVTFEQGVHAPANKLRKYRFEISPRKDDGRESFFITLELTQEQFDDFHHLHAAIRKEMVERGFAEGEAAWLPSPETDPDTEQALRKAIGAGPDSKLIATYADQQIRRDYKRAMVNGREFAWMPFSQKIFIKYAEL